MLTKILRRYGVNASHAFFSSAVLLFLPCQSASFPVQNIPAQGYPQYIIVHRFFEIFPMDFTSVFKKKYVEPREHFTKPKKSSTQKTTIFLSSRIKYYPIFRIFRHISRRRKVGLFQI
jgi:hypothetical protein